MHGSYSNKGCMDIGLRGYIWDMDTRIYGYMHGYRNYKDTWTHECKVNMLRKYMYAAISANIFDNYLETFLYLDLIHEMIQVA